MVDDTGGTQRVAAVSWIPIGRSARRNRKLHGRSFKMWSLRHFRRAMCGSHQVGFGLPGTSSIYDDFSSYEML